MRFTFNQEEEAFRAELRAFLDERLPPGWTGPADESQDADWTLTMSIRRELARRGWLTMSWPVEYGGRAASPMMSLVFAEEMAYRRAPGNDRFGTRMIGPILMSFGSDEQKRAHLPAIARADVQWCQGYSEPDSGSDLASLKTRAVDAGDHFVVNGGKVWTSLAHRAGWMFMLARTGPDEPRHRGISMLLVDMTTPGITVRPIINMAGSHSFNQVTFDDVRVPRTGLVGALNDGWRVGTALLNFERANIDYVAWAQRTLDELKDFARSSPGRAPGAARLSDDPDVRRRIAEFEIQIEQARLITYEAAWRQAKGENPVMEASMSKLLGSEVNLRVHEFGVEMLGMYGQLEPGSAPGGPGLDGRITKLRFYFTSGPILAGTSEIQRNIIAQRGLGLPRE
ncbi:MAG: acyl-CoA dehydrogenase [Dehalococcoidia bacterium]|nr:acyl-CoA dehydrogenase [Dehalococcoidia bacterium]MSQ35125.1 acyl-CoA dehydrogenase [Dehalococcoidia bacterium]